MQRPGAGGAQLVIAPPSHFPGCPIFLPPTSTDPNVPNPTTNKMILSLTPSLNFLCKLNQGFYCLGKLRSQPCYKKCRDFLIFTLSFFVPNFVHIMHIGIGKSNVFSIKHDLARSCFKFWLKIGDEGDKISKK